MIVVQGDTTTALCGALSGFYAGVRVAHVEAGLRTFDMQAPFPEEMNRLITSRLASVHFAATDWAASNLAREGVAPETIFVTGNTGIDAVAIYSGRAGERPTHVQLFNGPEVFYGAELFNGAKVCHRDRARDP